MSPERLLIAVVIPTYKAVATITRVLGLIGQEVGLIVVVDDCCPQNSGAFVTANCSDTRILVIRHEVNLGVGGAVLTGMQAAIERGADIIVKVDADGQIDPRLIPGLVRPIEKGWADCVKGNRFFFLSDSRTMPGARRFGNLGLSFLTKLSTGYWNVMDPTNGFFAIESRVARALPVERIERRFFFESDLLFNLGLLRAKVVDFPMLAVYGDEKSNLSPLKSFFPFLWKNLKNFLRRLVYKYFVRDFSLASLELLFGLIFLITGLVVGGLYWYHGIASGKATPTGIIIIVALLLNFGFQLLLSFLNYDVATTPREPLHPLLEKQST